MAKKKAKKKAAKKTTKKKAKKKQFRLVRHQLRKAAERRPLYSEEAFFFICRALAAFVTPSRPACYFSRSFYTMRIDTFGD